MVTLAIQSVYQENAEEELRNIRENCGKWSVKDNIENMRYQLRKAGLSLADIGTSEEELNECFQSGQKRAALAWLHLAKTRCEERDVSFVVRAVLERLAEADLTLNDIGSSQEEIIGLLPAQQAKVLMVLLSDRAWKR